MPTAAVGNGANTIQIVKLLVHKQKGNTHRPRPKTQAETVLGPGHRRLGQRSHAKDGIAAEPQAPWFRSFFPFARKPNLARDEGDDK